MADQVLSLVSSALHQRLFSSQGGISLDHREAGAAGPSRCDPAAGPPPVLAPAPWTGSVRLGALPPPTLREGAFGAERRAHAGRWH